MPCRRARWQRLLQCWLVPLMTESRVGSGQPAVIRSPGPDTHPVERFSKKCSTGCLTMSWVAQSTLREWSFFDWLGKRQRVASDRTLSRQSFCCPADQAATPSEGSRRSTSYLSAVSISSTSDTSSAEAESGSTAISTCVRASVAKQCLIVAHLVFETGEVK